jgi:hypothetical protein
VNSANRLLDAALEIQAFCEAKGWPFCFIGGLAVVAWGEPRLTRDADLTVFTGVGGEVPYVDDLLARFHVTHPTKSTKSQIFGVAPRRRGPSVVRHR